MYTHASIPRSTSGTATCPSRGTGLARPLVRTAHTNPKHACPHLYKLPTVHCTSSTAGIMSHPWNRGPTPCRLPCDRRRSKLQLATASETCTSYLTRATQDAGQSPPLASTLATTASKSQGVQSRRGDRRNGKRGAWPSRSSPKQPLFPAQVGGCPRVRPSRAEKRFQSCTYASGSSRCALQHNVQATPGVKKERMESR